MRIDNIQDVDPDDLEKLWKASHSDNPNERQEVAQELVQLLRDVQRGQFTSSKMKAITDKIEEVKRDTEESLSFFTSMFSGFGQMLGEKKKGNKK